MIKGVDDFGRLEISMDDGVVNAYSFGELKMII
jgi:hypothetical protein